MASLNDIKAYRSWRMARARCFNPKNNRYPEYGARGITMCSRWANSFDTFLEDLGDAPSSKHSIERVNNDGNYEPGNCRWATNTEQSRNKTTNVLITHNGQMRTMAEWAEVLGIPYKTMHWRYTVKGWSMTKIADTTVREQWNNTAKLGRAA